MDAAENETAQAMSLEDAYREADEEWRASGEAEVWDGFVGDVIDD
ncbi:MAG: hypothetical protein QM708_05735 [Propioniciclava sp.]